MAAGMEKTELSHELVSQNADRVTSDFARLIRALIEKMDVTDGKKKQVYKYDCGCYRRYL